MQRGGGVGRGNAVAGIAADGACIADLGTAYHVHRLAQHIDVFLDDGVVGNMRKAGQAADTDVLLVVDGYAPHLITLLDGDQGLTGPFAFPHLHQYIGAACNDLCLRMLQTKAHSILYVFCLIKG